MKIIQQPTVQIVFENRVLNLTEQDIENLLRFTYGETPTNEWALKIMEDIYKNAEELPS